MKLIQIEEKDQFPPEYKYLVSFEYFLSYSLMSDVTEWCENTLEGEWNYSDTTPTGDYFIFELESDAELFMLRWS